jgi:hypothetical protein
MLTALVIAFLLSTAVCACARYATVASLNARAAVRAALSATSERNDAVAAKYEFD